MSALRMISMHRALQNARPNICRQCAQLALAYRVTISPITATCTSKVQQRCLHASAKSFAAPKTKDRGPTSKEDTQTDFNAMNVLGSMPAPTTAVDMCMEDGFALDSGMRISGAGVLLAAGEAFAWRPWTGSEGRLRNKKGQFHIDNKAWSVLKLLWPKPDLLIIGTGPSIAPLSPGTRQQLNELGIRVEVQDTRNAAAQFNLLATERGVQEVAAALIPIGWRDAR